MGAKPLLNHEVKQLITDVVKRQDRANEGLTRSAIVDRLQDFIPHKSRYAISQAFHRTVQIKPEFGLTKGQVIAQASTDKRNQITFHQQHRWYETVSESFDFLRVRNCGVTPDGYTFGEVMPHFIIGGDEIGFQANGAEVTIVGDAHRRKHEKDTASSRVSISVYRTGSTAGSTGPSVILPPGVRKATGWTDAFLVTHGAAPGSTIVMTDSGYMTEEAWRECAPSVIAGIRNMPVIKDNPNWSFMLSVALFNFNIWL